VFIVTELCACSVDVKPEDSVERMSSKQPPPLKRKAVASETEVT